MDNLKTIVGNRGALGKALFAKELIKKDEHIASFDGLQFNLEEWFAMPDDLALEVENHAIQYGSEEWRDSKGVARILNHSCEPNCGIKGLFDIVAMRDIKPGEELLWDYGMSEDHVWRMACRCHTRSCRRVIGSFETMPSEIRNKYKGYISEWLVHKYSL